MKFKIKTSALKEVVSSVSRVVDPRPATPSLQGIYLKTREDLLEVVGSDLDIVLKARTGVKTEVEGETLVNARVLSEIVRKLPTGEVTFSDIGTELKVETKKMEFKLRKLDEKTYPEALLEDNTNKNTEEVEVTELFESIKKVGIASSPEGGRPVLTGVYFNNKNDATELVATDSYRLATYSLSEIPIKDIGIISYLSLIHI